MTGQNHAPTVHVTRNHARTSYRPDIDGLRAVAVLSVLLTHAGLGFPGGYVGVDVFFVISGYLITGLILKDLAQGTFSLADFWERRVRRILPALLVVTLVTIVLGWFIFLPDAFQSLGKSVAALALLISNFQFWRDTGYFEASSEEKPLLHTWSLAVEEQFYFFVPVFLLLLSRVERRRAVQILGVIMAASFGVSVIGAYRYPGATFYLLPTRAWELFVGSMLAFLPTTARGTPWMRQLAGPTGLLAILVPCWIYHDRTVFPGLTALPPVLGSALLIWSGGPTPEERPWVSRLLAWRPVVFIGLISYSLYLWHWPVMAFTRYQSLYPLSLLERWGLVGVSLGLAVLSWRFIEVPFRTKRLFVTRQQLVTATAVIFVVVLGMGTTIYWKKGFEQRVPQIALDYAAARELDLGPVHEHDVNDVPDKLFRFGNTDAPVELLVWGDSHAKAVLPAIEAVCKESGVSGCAATHSATAPVLDYFSRQRFGLNEQSLPFNAAVMDFIRREKISTVVLIGFWSSYFEDAEFESALMKTIAELQAQNVRVCFMLDVPDFRFNVPMALARYSAVGRDLKTLAQSRAEYDRLNQFQTTVIPKLEQQGVIVIDPMPTMQATSGNSVILPFDEGGSFYRDSHHLSTYGAMRLKPLFEPIVQGDEQTEQVAAD